MLYKEIIAVCSQIHTKHKNTLCGWKVELLNVNLAVHMVTTELYSVKAHTAFDSCSTGHAVSISNLYSSTLYIYSQFVLCCVTLCSAGDTLQCYNCSQQTTAKCQQSIYCVIRTSLPVSSRHILMSLVAE